MRKIVGFYGLALLAACQGEAGEATHEISTDSPFPGRPVSCIAGTGVPVQATIVHSILADNPPSTNWAPGHVTDFAFLPDGSVLAMDEMLSEISHLSAQLTPIYKIGDKGQGPSHFLMPKAIATQDSLLFVIDPRSRDVETFHGRLGSFLASQNLTLSFANDLQVQRDTMYVVATVFTPLFEQGTTETVSVSRIPFLYRFAVGSEEVDSLLFVTREDLKTTRLPLPGPVHPRIRKTTSLTSIFWPASGRIELFQDVSDTVFPQTVVETCKPERLIELYDEQWSQSEDRQVYVTLVTDVFLGDSVIYSVGPLSTSDSKYHVDRFRMDGTPLPSLTFDLPLDTYFHEARFWNEPFTLLFTTPEGTFYKVQLQPSDAG